MAEDEEVEMIMFPPSKDQLQAFTGKELSQFLKKKGFPVDQCRILEENQVDGKLFVKLSRSDLKDLYPSDFSARKKFWDFLSELASSDPWSPRESSTPKSSVSTLSPCSSSCEEDVSLSQSMSASDLPSLKRTKQREFVHNVPAKKAKRCLLETDFKFPISAKVKKCVQNKSPLDDSDRRQLIRESVTCLQAYVGDQHISSSCFEEAAKQLCDKVPLLRDEKPPLRPHDVEFQYWASTKHLLKKRYSNVKSMNVKASKKVSQLSDSSISDVDIESQSKADLEKHEKELAKELGKKVINWKAAEQLLNLTFVNRRERVSKITGLNAVPNMLEQFPYFEHEKVLLWELEFQISKLTKKKCTSDVFIDRWKAQSTCFLDGSDINNDDTALQSLSNIHKPFSGMEPLLLTLKETEKIENFIKTEVPSKSPYLVYAEVNQTESNDTAQVFVILDKDVLCECMPVVNHSIFTSSLVTLVAVYYSFNLEYEQKRKHFFTLVEEHVLGIVPKRKPYLLKQLENRLLSKMNKVSNE